MGLLFGFVCLPRAVGFLLGCFVGCGMWVLGFVFRFDWLFVLVVPVCG